MPFLGAEGIGSTVQDTFDISLCQNSMSSCVFIGKDIDSIVHNIIRYVSSKRSSKSNIPIVLIYHNLSLLHSTIVINHVEPSIQNIKPRLLAVNNYFRHYGFHFDVAGQSPV